MTQPFSVGLATSNSVIRPAQDLDTALQFMSKDFTPMHKQGLSVNATKTLVLIDSKGNRASKLLSKAVVHKQGKGIP